MMNSLLELEPSEAEDFTFNLTNLLNEDGGFCYYRLEHRFSEEHLTPQTFSHPPRSPQSHKLCAVNSISRTASPGSMHLSKQREDQKESLCQVKIRKNIAALKGEQDAPTPLDDWFFVG
ncbi:hypothetical protein [Lyngbya aestuarii]|uniref:hypothetical protein n=1 Tax=Lyngbya aestuarii TaxID=118322 RepID=UPI00403E2757